MQGYFHCSKCIVLFPMCTANAGLPRKWFICFDGEGKHPRTCNRSEATIRVLGAFSHSVPIVGIDWGVHKIRLQCLVWTTRRDLRIMRWYLTAGGHLSCRWCGGWSTYHWGLSDKELYLLCHIACQSVATQPCTGSSCLQPIEGARTGCRSGYSGAERWSWR